MIKSVRRSGLPLGKDTRMTKQHPNPMNSRCGLEDCDCGYVIEKLEEVVKVDGCDYYTPPTNCLTDRVDEENWCLVCRLLYIITTYRR